MNTAVIVIKIIVYTVVIYFIELLFLYTFLSIFQKPLTKFLAFLPGIIVFSIVVFLIIGFFYSDILFQIFWALGTGLLSFEIYLIFFVILYLILSKANCFCCKTCSCWQKMQEKFKIYIWIPLLIVLLIPTAFTIYGFINPWIIHIDSEKILEYENFEGKIKICHLSDIHLGALITKRFIKKIVKKVKTINPDIVVITGDFADGSLKVKAEWMLPFNELEMPILYVTGNHESYRGEDEMIEEVNKTKIIYVGDKVYDEKGIRFIGVDYKYDLEERLDEFKNQGLLEFDDKRPNVLLNHIPELEVKDLKKWNIFLYLCGHTHGGQIFPKNIINRYKYKIFKGLYKGDDLKNYAYVSQGLGFGTFPMRTFTESTIAVISIKGKIKKIMND